MEKVIETLAFKVAQLEVENAYLKAEIDSLTQLQIEKADYTQDLVESEDLS